MENNEAATKKLLATLHAYGRVRLTIPAREGVSREQLGLAVLQMLGLSTAYTMAITPRTTDTLVWLFAPGR